MNKIKNISLSKTTAALAELSQALLALDSAIDNKTIELKKISKESLEKLEKCKKEKLQLQEISQKTINNINMIMQNIDKVLENNGSGNSNN